MTMAKRVAEVQEKPPHDLLDYLWRNQGSPVEVAGFIEKAREFLAGNPVVSYTTVDGGELRLADGTVVPIMAAAGAAAEFVAIPVIAVSTDRSLEPTMAWPVHQAVERRTQ
jgi:hypothetical protein